MGIIITARIRPISALPSRSASLLNLGFVGVETAYGFWANSMALLADAGHNLSDVLGLVAAWGAAILSKRPPTRRFSYGFSAASILAALANALLLIIAVALYRLSCDLPADHPRSGRRRDGDLVVAAIGIAINGATALMFARGRHSDINVRGAYLHMVADALVSAGVVVAGIAITADRLAVDRSGHQPRRRRPDLPRLGRHAARIR